MERGNLRRLIVALALAAWSLAASPALAADEDVCAAGEMEASVAACTRLIGSGKLSGRALAIALARRCTAYNYRNLPDRAIADCDEALKVDPTFLIALANRCWANAIKHDFDRALADCNETIRRDPGLASGYYQRGSLYERRGEMERALADFAEAIRVDPKYPFAYRSRCAIYVQRNDPERALADCNEAVRLNPNSPSFLNTRCWNLNKKKEPELALADCDKALALNPNWTGAYINRCESHILKQDPDRAIADCDEAIRLSSRNAAAFNNRCWARVLKREADAAIADCDEALRLNPKGYFTYNHRGNAWRHKGERERAVADYGEAIRLDPKYASPYGNRGALYEEAGKLDLALSDFRAAAALEPKNATAAARLQRIEAKIAETAGTTAAPAKATGGEKRVALLIGNGNYVKVAPLANAKRDTETLAVVLRRIGFSVVTLQQDVSREQLLAALQAFAREADRADWAVVYYAGHGIEVSGVNYLIPVDAKLAADRDVPFETIALDQVLLSVEGARKLRLVILDACRDNPFRQTMSRSIASRSIGRGLARVEPEGATLVAFAAKAGQVAMDGTGTNSPFATALVKYLETPGLELNFLFRKVRDEVLGATERQQEPFTYGSLPAEAFYFRHP